ncbi:MAG: hypothetical protein R2755_02745 [Acidimicrobiales bacterium]
MTDILIRDVPDDVVAALGANAQRAGLARAEYLRRVLAEQQGPRSPATNSIVSPSAPPIWAIPRSWPPRGGDRLADRQVGAHPSCDGEWIVAVAHPAAW